MTWFKKKEEDVGVCKDCVFRTTGLRGEPVCWVSGACIKKGMPDTCEIKRVGGCATCQNRISDIHDCRGIKVCQCAVSGYDNNFVKVKTQCGEYAYIEHEEAM